MLQCTKTSAELR